MKRKMRELVEGALWAHRAGVVLRLKDWNGFSDKEKRAWITAKAILEAPPKVKAFADPSPSPEPDVDEVEDLELRSAIERGADLVAARASSES